MSDLAWAGEEEWHYVPFPEHYADVMDTAGRGHTYEGRTEVDHRWYWETGTAFSGGMVWSTMTCIFMLDSQRNPITGKPYASMGGARCVRLDDYEWRLIDPAHPRCWTCGRFFVREKWRNGHWTGPCERCDEGPYAWM